MNDLLQRLLTPPQRVPEAIRPILFSFPGLPRSQGNLAPAFSAEAFFYREGFPEGEVDSPDTDFLRPGTNSDGESEEVLLSPWPNSIRTEESRGIHWQEGLRRQFKNPKVASVEPGILLPTELKASSSRSTESVQHSDTSQDAPAVRLAIEAGSERVEAPFISTLRVSGRNPAANAFPKPIITRNSVQTPFLKSESNRGEAAGSPAPEDGGVTFRRMATAEQASPVSAQPIRPTERPVHFPDSVTQTPAPVPLDSGISAAPTIEITIGRIEINARKPNETQPMPRRESHYRPASLQEYLDNPGRGNFR